MQSHQGPVRTGTRVSCAAEFYDAYGDESKNDI